jgi:hypothetical protein
MDADGDGSDELMVVVEHPANDDGTTETLYCFTLQGALRYAYTPALTMTFEAGGHRGPWRFWDIEPVPEDRSVWVALERFMGWPASVMRIDANGAATRRYSQPRLVHALKSARLRDTHLMFVAGINNEFASASLAVLDLHGEPATAPQKGAGPFTCLDCPAGSPREFFLFPPTPLNTAEGLPYDRATTFVGEADATDVIVFETPGATVSYRVTSDLSVSSATPSDTYWTWKPQFDSQWRKSFTRPSALSVRAWALGTWTTRRIPVVGS